MKVIHVNYFLVKQQKHLLRKLQFVPPDVLSFYTGLNHLIYLYSSRKLVNGPVRTDLQIDDVSSTVTFQIFVSCIKLL